MSSRLEKYSTDDVNVESTYHSTRSNRNAKLYRDIYGNGDLDNLPVDDNTNEIDMEKLRELVLNKNSKKEEKEIKETLNVLEQRKRRIDEQKIYDINKILEKAKYENSKLKGSINEVTKPKRSILSTLGSSELSLKEINEAKKVYEEKVIKEAEKEEALSMTREMKYKDLGAFRDEKEENLSLELFQDLKPTGNTIITKPIKEDKEVKSDFRSSDTRDIDIIKKDSNMNKGTNDFFTNSYEFSKKDFAIDDDDDFFGESKKGGIFKIILLILAITIFVGVIIYFVGTYGFGIS